MTKPLVAAQFRYRFRRRLRIQLSHESEVEWRHLESRRDDRQIPVRHVLKRLVLQWFIEAYELRLFCPPQEPDVLQLPALPRLPPRLPPCLRHFLGESRAEVENALRDDLGEERVIVIVAGR